MRANIRHSKKTTVPVIELKDAFKNYLEHRYNNILDDESNKKTLRIIDYTFPENDDETIDIIITGTMLYGSYDEFQKLMNKNNGNLQDIGGNAVVRGYYFLFYLPARYNVGIALFHKYGKDGAMTQFKKDFQECLRYYKNKNDDRKYVISFESTFPKWLLDEYIDKGSVKRMKHLNFISADEMGNAYDSSDDSCKIAKETIYSIRGKPLPINKELLKKLVNKKISKEDFITIPEFKDADEIKFELDINGITRTICVEKEEVVPYIDITAEIEKHNNYYETIDIEAKKLLVLLRNQIYKM